MCTTVNITEHLMCIHARSLCQTASAAQLWSQDDVATTQTLSTESPPYVPWTVPPQRGAVTEVHSRKYQIMHISANRKLDRMANHMAGQVLDIHGQAPAH